MLQEFGSELWRLLLDLSGPLLLGILLGGLLHAFLPAGLIRRRLSTPDGRSVLRAVLVGLPLPLCSCGVAPTAIGIRNEGASRGAATGFLISTPQTGVDSILVSASFLGWPFALFKVAAAFVTGCIGGLLVNRWADGEPPAGALDTGTVEPRETGNRWLSAVRYAVFDLLGMIDLWIVAGILIAAALSVAVPEGSLHEIGWTRGLGGMLLVLAFSLPLYVCTTGSVPIAAVLIAAGMPTGTALVFLMAGPATNIATMGAVYRGLGGRVLAIYLGTVTVMSIAFGLGFDFVLGDVSAPVTRHVHGTDWLGTICAILLLSLLALLSVRRIVMKLGNSKGTAAPPGSALTLRVEGMSCSHCVSNVKRTLEALAGLDEATVDLSSGRVFVKGSDLDPAVLVRAIERAGYKVVGTVCP